MRSLKPLASCLGMLAATVKLVEWASLDDELSAIREPQLIDAFQVRNNLLLTFGLSAGGPKVEPEE